MVEPLFFADPDILGEGPYWEPARARLLWMDIMDNELHAIDADGAGHTVVRTQEKVHAIAACAAPGRFLCTAHRHGLAWLDAEDGSLVPLLDPEPDAAGHLLNDARCDASGRFWFGSLHKRHEPTGALYSIDGDGHLVRQAEGFGASNGIAFSPDGRQLYFADTYVGVFAFDLVDGAARAPRLILRSGELPGHPDGLTVDTDGCLWVAMALGGRVARITPAGKIDRVVPVPATFVTSCTFGGPELDTLFITSARAGRPADELAREPYAGALFAVRLGHRGLPEVPYAGPAAVGR